MAIGGHNAEAYGQRRGWFSRATLEAQTSEKTQQRLKRATREIETSQEVIDPLSEYEPQAIEAKWQKIWEEQGAFHADRDAKRPKYYVLEMLPYPSGTL